MEKYSEMSIRQEKVNKLIQKIKSESAAYIEKIKKTASDIDFENMSEKEEMTFDIMNNDYFYIKRLLEYISLEGVFMEYEAIYMDKDVIIYTIPSEKIDIFLLEDFNFVVHFLSDIEMSVTCFEEDDKFKSPYKAADVFAFLNPHYLSYNFLTAIDEILYEEKLRKKMSRVSNIVTSNLKITLRSKSYHLEHLDDMQVALDTFEADMNSNSWVFEVVKADVLDDSVIVYVKTTSTFSDDVSDEYTVQYLIEQDLEDMGWDCDVEVET